MIEKIGSYSSFDNNGFPHRKISPCTRFYSYITSPGPVSAVATGIIYAALGYSAPIVAGGGIAALFLYKRVNHFYRGGNNLRPAVFVAAEPLSKEMNVHNGQMKDNIPPVLDALRKMTCPNSKKAISCLENMLFYEQTIDITGLRNQELISDQQELIRQMRLGDVVALPCSWFSKPFFPGHVMVLGIEYYEEGKYRASIFNGGEGHEKYHYRRGKLYQIAHRIEAIDLPNLLNLIPELVRLHAWRGGNSSEKLYSKLIPSLAGLVMPPIEDPRFWDVGQSGGSCAGYTIHLLLKFLLTEGEYCDFTKHFSRNMSQKLQEGLRSSYRFWEQSPAHEVAMRAMEGRRQLLEEGGFALPQQLVFSHDPHLPSSSRLGRLMHYQPGMEKIINKMYVSSADGKQLEELFHNGQIDDEYIDEVFNRSIEVGNSALSDELFATGKVTASGQHRAIFTALKRKDALWVEKLSVPLDEYARGDALLEAVNLADTKLVGILRNSGEILDEDLKEMLFIAVDQGDTELIQSLLGPGRIFESTRAQGNTLSTIAVQLIKMRRPKLVFPILAPVIRIPDSYQEELLEEARNSGDQELVAALQIRFNASLKR